MTDGDSTCNRPGAYGKKCRSRAVARTRDISMLPLTQPTLEDEWSNFQKLVVQRSRFFGGGPWEERD